MFKTHEKDKKTGHNSADRNAEYYNCFALFPHFARFQLQLHIPHWARRFAHAHTSVSTKYFNLFSFSNIIRLSTCADCKLLLTGNVFNLTLCQISIILLDLFDTKQPHFQRSKGMTNHRNGPQRTICEEIKPNLSPLLPFSDLFWSIVIRCG